MITVTVFIIYNLTLPVQFSFGGFYDVSTHHGSYSTEDTFIKHKPHGENSRKKRAFLG